MFLCAHIKPQFNMCMYQQGFMTSIRVWKPISNIIEVDVETQSVMCTYLRMGV